MNFLLTILFLFVSSFLYGGTSLHYVNHWHLHQPNYWPNKTRATTEDRKEVTAESINFKNYDPWAGHPTPDLSGIFGLDDRKAAYQWRPKDALSTITSYPEAGFTISYSGALIEGVKSLGNAYMLGYSPDWNSGFREARTWTTSGGKTRMDIVLFTYHHTLPGLLNPEFLKKEIQLYKAIYQEAWGTTPGVSKGFWSAECAFSERIIPTLLEEGITWTFVANTHISRAYPEWPGTAYNTDPPNKADQRNVFPQGYTPRWRAASIDGRPTTNELRYSYRPHYAQYIDPETGQAYKIIVVPMADYESYVDGYQMFPVDLFDEIAAAGEPSQPPLVVLAHDGDNAWGGGYDSWMNNTPNKASAASAKGYTPSQVEQYLADHPVDPNDIIHVEDGPWVCPDGDFGSPMFIKWNWPWRYYDGVNRPTFDPTCWTEDAQFWAVYTAGLNRIVTLEESGLQPAVNIQNVLHPTNPGTTNLEKAWHYFLAGFDSGHIYYGGAEDFSMIPILAQNNAMQYVDAILGEGELQPGSVGYEADKTSPTIFYVSRFPYNPGELNRGPAYGYKDWIYPPDFYVYTFVYDASGLSSVKLKYRISAGPTPTIANMTYAGGPGIGPWQEIVMSSAPFVVKILVQNTDVTNTPPYNTFRPKYLPLRYWAHITGVQNQLVDYYVEAVDKKGLVRKSPIYHCWVGSGGGAGTVLWSPTNPTQADKITIKCPDNKPGWLHWGVNNWTQPVPAFWPEGTTPYDSRSVDTPLISTNTIPGATYYCQIGPFLPVSTQNVIQVDFCFRYADGTWNNNNGADWHITILPKDLTPPATPQAPVLTSMNSAVGVSWWPNTEPDIAGYNIYWWDEVTQSTTSKRNSSLVTGTTFYDGGLTNGTPYTYVITAVDTAENESWYSQPRTTTPYATDTIPAGPVTGLKGYSGEELINLSWTKNLELDVLYYRIYRSTYSCVISQKSLITTILHPGTTHQDTGLSGGVTYYYQMTNVDTSNNESVPSDEISVLALVNPPPLAPTGFIAVPSSGVVYLKWNKNTEPDLNGYRLYRSTYPGGYSLVVGTTTLTASTSIYTDTGLTNGTTYFYRLTALDIAGNESSYSTEVTAKPDELIECVFSVDMRSQGATVTSVQIVSNLIWPPWTPQATQLTNNGNNIWFKTLYLPKANNMQYKYVMNGTVWENDFPDGPSIYRDIFISSNNPDGKMYNSNVWNQDGDPAPLTPTPSPPLATGLSNGKTYIKWNANTDWDLYGYRVYRSTGQFLTYNLITNLLTQTTFQDTGLINGVTYWYKIAAVDLAGQESAHTLPVSAVAGVNLPPSPPTNLQVVSSSETTVNLLWSPNTTDADLKGYKVYWSTIASGGPYNFSSGLLVSTTYQADGLQVGVTHYFVVRSVDLEDLESANSNEVSVLTKPPLVFEERVIDGDFLDWKFSDVRYIDPYNDTYNFNDGYDTSRDIVAVYSREGQNNYYFRVDFYELGIYAENNNLDLYIAIDCAPGGQIWLPDFTDCQTDTPWEVCIALYNTTTANIYKSDWSTVNTAFKGAAFNSQLDSVELAIDKSVLRSYGWTDGQPIRLQVFTTRDGTNGGSGEIPNTSDLTDAIVDQDRGFSDGILNGCITSTDTVGQAKYAFIYHGNQSLNSANDIKQWIERVEPPGSVTPRTGYVRGLEVIENYGVKGNINISGSLASAIQWAQPSFNQRIKNLVQQGKVKLLGGVFAEHIMPYFENIGEYNVNLRSAELRKKILSEIYGLTTPPKVFWTPERVIRGQTFQDILTAGYKATVIDQETHLQAWQGNQNNPYKVHKFNGVYCFIINGNGPLSPDETKFWNQDGGLHMETRKLLIDLARSSDQNQLCLVFDDWEAYAGRSFTSTAPNDNADNWERTIKWIANHQWIKTVTLEEIVDEIDSGNTSWVIDHGTSPSLSLQTYDWLLHASENSYDNWYYGSSLEQSFKDAQPVLQGAWNSTKTLMPSGKTYGHITINGTILRDAWTAIKNAPNNQLKNLAEAIYNLLIFETAWHDEDNTDKYGPADTTYDNISAWALALHSHVRYAVVIASAACWAQEVANGGWTTTSVQAADVDLDGENEYILKNNKVFAVFENDGGRLVQAFAYHPDPLIGAVQLIGAPGTNYEQGNEGEEVRGLHYTAFREMNDGIYENAIYSVQLWQSSITFTSPDGYIKKTIRLENNSDTLQAYYSVSNIPRTYIRFGLTPNYYDCIFNGKKNWVEISSGTIVGIKNIVGGEVLLDLGNTTLNTAFSDGTSDNTNSPHIKGYEIYGDGNSFTCSLILRVYTPPTDTIPPAAITDLTASTGANYGEINLSWTAPGDDGTEGNNTAEAKYIVKYATWSPQGDINLWWNNAWVYPQTWTVSPVGTKEQKTVTGLIDGTWYYFGIKTVDDAGNVSDIQMVASAQTKVDDIPPAAITTLVATPTTVDGEVILSWLAPGDDETTGTIVKGIWRISYSTYTPYLWSIYDYKLDISTANVLPLSNQSIKIQGLLGGVTYYFRIWTQDDSFNWSDISNGATCQPYVDNYPPQAVTNLVAQQGSNPGEIYLSWTSPGDDGLTGVLPPGSKFRIQQSTFSNVSWSTANAQIEIPAEGYTPGQTVTKLLTGLSIGITYYFRVWTSDEKNWSEYSNLTSTTPQPGDVYPPGKITTLVAYSGTNFQQVTLRWIAPGDDGYSNTLPSGSKFQIKFTTDTSKDFTTAENTINIDATGVVPGSQQTYVVSDLTPGIRYYFWIRTCDEQTNWSEVSNQAQARAAGTYHNIVVDGYLTDWDVTTERVASDTRNGDTTDFYFTWSSTAIYFAWSGRNWSDTATGDFFIYFDTNPGTNSGTSRGVGAYEGFWDNNDHYFPESFKPEYVFATECGSNGYWEIRRSTAPATWNDRPYYSGGPSSGVITFFGNPTCEVCIPFTVLDNPSVLNILAYAKVDTTKAVFASYPTGNPASSTTITETFTQYYQIKITSGVFPSESFVYVSSIPPAAVTDLTAQPGTADGEVSLSWTSPGEDDTTGVITKGEYRVQYATYTIGIIWSYLNAQVSKPIENVSPGTKLYCLITGLVGGVTYYFHLWTCDSSGNWSGLSNRATAQASVSDTTPPNAITDLVATTGTADYTIDLTWTAPGDDGTVGDNTLSAKYILKYATFSVDTVGNASVWWDHPLVFTYQQSWIVSPQGTKEQKTLSGFSPGTTYYFAIKTVDDANNVSPIDTNATSGSTQAKAYAKSPLPDTIPPAVITDLSAFPGDTPGSIKLTWTSPGDDGLSGIISNGEYKIQFSSYIVDWSTTAAQISVSTSTLPLYPQTYVISTGLIPGVTYYFRIWTRDESFNWSDVSNGATTWAQTGDNIPPADITDLQAFTGPNFGQVTLCWTAPGNNGDDGDIVDGEYLIKYSLNPTDGFSLAPNSVSWKKNITHGTIEYFTISGLNAYTSYYFWIKTKDDSGNWSVNPSNTAVTRAAGTFHTITIDGSPSDWHSTSERIEVDNENGGAREFWVTWDTEKIYFGYGNNKFNDMDLFILIDTHTDYTVAIGSRSPPAWDNMESHYLPIYADYALTIEGSGYKALRQWTGTSWTVPPDGTGISQAYINDTAVGGFSEVAILRSTLNNPTKIHVIALHKWENARNIYASFPTKNPAPNTDTATTFNYFYTFVLSSGVFPVESSVYVQYGDTTPPAAITTLQATPGTAGGTVKLTWIATGDDNYSGTIINGEYRIQYSQNEFETNWSTQAAQIVISTNVSAGTNQTYIVSGLTPGVTYYFRIWLRDEIPTNWSAISNGATAYAQITVDTTPPGPITNLSAFTGNKPGEVILRWTAPGDDGYTGNNTSAAKYVLKYATYPVTTSVDLWWEQATVWPDAQTWSVSPVGTTEEKIITGLIPGITYYFAIKTVDDANNVSEIDTNAASAVVVDIIEAENGILSDGAMVEDDPTCSGGKVVKLDSTAGIGPKLTVTIQNSVSNAPIQLMAKASATQNAQYQKNGVQFYNYSSWNTASYSLTSAVYQSFNTGDTFSVYPDQNFVLRIDYIKIPGAFSAGTKQASAKAKEDDIPPSAITDLSALPGTQEGEVILTWTAPGNDGNERIISSGEFRIQRTTDVMFNLWSPTATPPSYAPIVSVSTTNVIPGSRQSYVLGGLQGGTTYYFRIWTCDEVSNWSEISNAATAYAYDGPDTTPPGKITDLVALSGNNFQEIVLQWTAPGDNGYSGNIVNGKYQLKYSSYLPETDGWQAAPYSITWTTTTSPGNKEIFIITGLSAADTFYFWLKTSDESDNWADLPSDTATARSPATYHNILCDGATNEWTIAERLDVDNRNGWNKEFYLTWSSTAIYICYPNTDLSSNNSADLFVLFDTHTQYGVAIGTRSPPAWDNMQSHILPFYADYCLSIEKGDWCVLDRWDGSSWVNDGHGANLGQIYIGWSGNGNTEVTIPLSSLNNPKKIRVLALHKWDDARNIFASFPIENPAPNTDVAVTCTAYYLIDLSPGKIPAEVPVLSEEDVTPPSAVTDLVATVGSSPGEIILSWTSPGDDGVNGTIVNGAYKVRYATFSTVDFASDSPPWTDYKNRYEIVWSTTTDAFVPQTCVLTGLFEGVTYYICLWTRDEVDNWSLPSNIATSQAQVTELGVEIDITNYDFGILQVGISTITTSSATVTNTGNTNATWLIKATTNTVGTPWQLSDHAGIDKFVLWTVFNSVRPTDNDFGDEDKLSYNYQVCTSTCFAADQTGVAVTPKTSRLLWWKLQMPLVSNTTVQQEIKIEITAQPP